MYIFGRVMQALSAVMILWCVAFGIFDLIDGSYGYAVVTLFLLVWNAVNFAVLSEQLRDWDYY